MAVRKYIYNRKRDWTAYSRKRALPPRKRSYSYAKRRFHFVRPSDRVGRNMSLQQKLAAVVESKYVDGSLDSTVVSTPASAEQPFEQNTATYGCLPVPDQGDGFYQRDGRKIFVKWVAIRGIVHWPSDNAGTVPNTTGPVRIVIVKDTQTNKVQLSSENVINTGTGSDGNQLTNTASAINCFTNPIGWGRYKILKDFTVTPPQIPNNADGGGTVSIDQNGLEKSFHVKVKANCYMNFDGTTGAVGSIIDNSFHMLTYTTGASTLVPEITAFARTAFIG